MVICVTVRVQLSGVYDSKPTASPSLRMRFGYVTIIPDNCTINNIISLEFVHVYLIYPQHTLGYEGTRYLDTQLLT